MTRIEDRLTDALHAKAAVIEPRPVRPLPRRRPSRRAGVILAPLGAAIAVVIVAVLVLVLRPDPAAGPGNVATPRVVIASPVPPLYAEIGGSGLVVVRSVASGQVVARVTAPPGIASGVLAAGPDGRTFYLRAFRLGIAVHPGFATDVYSFRVGRDGVATPMRLVPHTRMDNVGALAVSPDGTRIAFLTSSDPLGWDHSDVIVVVNLRTGVRHTWRGGVPKNHGPHGSGMDVRYLSWSDNRTLTFATTWCDSRVFGYCGAGSAQVRTLDVASASGGSLADGTIVRNDLAAFPDITGMVADQRGHLDIMQVSGSSHPLVTVTQVPDFTAGPSRVLFRGELASGPDFYDTLGADPSGQHLFLFLNQKVHGWLVRDTLHQSASGRNGQFAW